MAKFLEMRGLPQLKPENLKKVGRISLICVSLLFLSYIAASMASTVGVMFLISSAMPRPQNNMSSSSGKAVAITNIVNYRDLRKEVIDRNLFNAEGEYPKEEAPGAGQENGLAVFDENAPCRKPTLPIELVGTIYLGESGKSLATIKEKGIEQADIYKAQDQIIGNELAKIHKIEQQRVIINNNGAKECLELALPAGIPNQDVAGGMSDGTSTSETGESCSSVVLEESYVSSQLGEGFANILAKGRLIPHSPEGQMVGFKLIGVDSKSLFGRICLKNGDVITQVNDTSLQQPEQGFALYQAFQDERELRISLLRNGKTPTTVNVQIK